MPVEQLIVGWNRGGLGYVHELLQRAELDAGLTFGPGTTLEEFLKKLPKAKRFEVSPYIVPFLGHPSLEHVKVTFIVRDPMRVLNSLYFNGLFHNEKNSAVQRAAFDHLTGFYAQFRGKPAQASCSYLHNWLKLAKQHKPRLQELRIEEGPRVLLKHLAGVSGPPPFLPPTINASNCKQMLVPSKLPKQARQGITTMLTRLGYREWAWMPRGGHAHFVNADWHS